MSMMYRRILVTGARGGCGKSTVAAGLACALALRGTKTALLDFDLAERSLDMYLGCESRAVYDLGDLLSGKRRPTGVAVPVPALPNLHFIPGAYHLRRMPNGEETERLFSSIEDDLDCEVLIVDTSSVSDPSVALCAARCDLTILPATAGVLSVRSVSSLADTLHEWGMDEIRLVVNRFSTNCKAPDSPDLRQMIDLTGLRLLGVVPYNELFSKEQDNGTPACFSPNSKDVAAAFANMASRLCGQICPLLSGTTLPRKKLLDI